MHNFVHNILLWTSIGIRNTFGPQIQRVYIKDIYSWTKSMLIATTLNNKKYKNNTLELNIEGI